jgi:hypothetical protein
MHGRRSAPSVPPPEELAVTDPVEPAHASAEVASAGPAVSVLAMVPVCGTARVLAMADDHLEVSLAGESVRAALDPSVHPVVIAGALARGERVLVEHRLEQGWVVVGALRTQPIPGIDAAEQFTIEANRVTIKAREELSLSARAASIVLRAAGEVETYADRILTRAEGLHKIVGRMLRLN